MKPERLQWSEVDSFYGNITDKSLVNYRPCPICGSISNRSLLVFDNFQFFSDSVKIPKKVEIREVQCQWCHGIFLNPGYSNLGFDCLFSEAGMSYGATEGRSLEQVHWLKKHGLLQGEEVVLDIGCYEGNFLSTLPIDVRRIGVDIDFLAIERGRAKFDKLGIELIHGRFESFNCSFVPNVISMFHVLEHLPDPYSVLEHLRNIAGSQTKLVVEVPVLEFGRTNDINGFMSVQHMTHFSIHSVQQLLQRAGWSVKIQEQIDGYNGRRIVAVPADKQDNIEGNISDVSEVYGYLGNWYENLENIAKIIDAFPEISRTVIWGAGLHTEFLYQVTPLFQKKNGCKYIIVDNDVVKQGKSWRGIPIYSPKVLDSVDWVDCLLVVSSYGGQESIVSSAVGFSVPDNVIYRLYTDVNVY